MKPLLSHLSTAIMALFFGAHSAGATIFDLGHPTIGHNFSTGIGGTGQDRNVAFNVIAGFTINSAGIKFDPLIGGSTQIGVDIYDMALTGGVGSRNSLMASATTAITDVGMAFYDIPVDFTFISGTRYNVAFRSVVPNVWGIGFNDFNNMEFYNFDFSNNAPFTVGGVLSVLDGGWGSAESTANAGFSNLATPHIRFLGEVPEPSSLTLAAFGLIGLATWGWRRKRAR